MKSLLFVTLVDVSAYGVRSLSAYIRQQGRIADTLCLRLSDNRRSLLSREPGGQVPSSLFETLLPFIEKYDCIGISLFSDGFNESVKITLEIKKCFPNKLIIWGGIHPTLKPVECLNYADYVCVGEGYYSLRDLLSRLDVKKHLDAVGLPQGIWSKQANSSIIENGCSEGCSNLDSLPFPNYNAESVYVRNNDNSISPLDREGYRKYLDYVYYTMFSRGCPYNCSYCCNNALKKLDKNYIKIRKHSATYIINEIKEAKKHYTFYNVYFMDDSFILMEDSAFEEFVERYPREVNLPLIITGLIPRFTTQKHIDKLVDAGMIRARIGIQTGSAKMLETYNRKQTNREVLKVSKMFSIHAKEMMPLAHDIILDGYNETIEDTIETALLVSKLERPLVLNLASLTAYPGTDISKKMPKYIPGDSCVRVNNTVINALIGLMSLIQIPPKLLKKILKQKAFLAKKVPPFVITFTYYAILIKKTIYHLYYGDYSSKSCWIVDIVRKVKKDSYNGR